MSFLIIGLLLSGMKIESTSLAKRSKSVNQGAFESYDTSNTIQYYTLAYVNYCITCHDFASKCLQWIVNYLPLANISPCWVSRTSLSFLHQMRNHWSGRFVFSVITVGLYLFKWFRIIKKNHTFQKKCNTSSEFVEYSLLDLPRKTI